MSRAGSVVTNTTWSFCLVGVGEPGQRRGDGAHHDLADVGTVGVAEEDQRALALRGQVERLAVGVGEGDVRYDVRLVESDAVVAVVVRRGDPGDRRAAVVRGAAADEQRSSAGRPGGAVLATAYPGGEVLGERGQRLEPAGRSSASSSVRTKAEPTITASAYDATSAAWSPLDTPSPTPIGRSVTCAGARDERSGELGGRRAGAGDAHDRGRVDEPAAGLGGVAQPLRRSRTARPGRPCRGRGRRPRRSTRRPSRA